MYCRALLLVLGVPLLLCLGSAEAETVENFLGAACPEGAVLRIGQPTPSDPGMLGEMLPLPDGRSVVVAGNDRMIRIFDLSTGVVLRKMGPQLGGFWREMVLSHDGRILACQSDYASNSIYVWDLESEKLLREVPRGESLAVVALSPNGSVLAWGNPKSPLKLLELNTGTELPVPRGADNGVISLGISADGRRLVSSGMDGSVRLFDLQKNVQLREFKLESPAYVAIAADGARIVTSCTNKVREVVIFDEAAGWTRMPLTPDCTYRVVISTDGKLLATGSAGIGGREPIQVWDMENAAPVSSLSASFACDPPVFVSGGSLLMAGDGTKLRTWHIASGMELESAPGHTGRAYFVSWSEDGRSLISAGAEGSIRRWDATIGKELSRLSTPGGTPYLSGYLPIASLAGNRLALSEDNSVVSIWTLDCEKQPKEFVVGERCLRGMALSPDGKMLASESDGTLVIRDIGSGDIQKEFKEPKEEHGNNWRGGFAGMITQSFAAWSPDGRLVAWSDRMGNDHLCDFDSGKMTSISFQGRATCARFSPDGKRLLIGVKWGRPAMVTVGTGKCETDLECASVETTALAWSPDGRQFAMGEASGLVSVCDPATGKSIRQFQAAPVPIRAVAFSPKSDRLASAGDDGAILIWNLGEAAKRPAEPDFDSAWRDLRTQNGSLAAAALAFFHSAGVAGAEELARRLEEETSPEETDSWIGQLDSEDPGQRDRARTSLADAGVLVEFRLRSASGTSFPEAGAALRELLAALNAPLVQSCGSLRRLRALQIIESIGSPAAKKLLVRLAGRSTSEVEKAWAEACLRRLH
ncbi:MAG: hypothetical protein AAB074_17170 [Planctomycetota bacterium]